MVYKGYAGCFSSFFFPRRFRNTIPAMASTSSEMPMIGRKTSHAIAMMISDHASPNIQLTSPTPASTMLPKNGSTLNSIGSNPNMPFRPITMSSTPTRRSTQVNMLFSD